MLTIVEDSSDIARENVKQHLQALVNSWYTGKENASNPWMKEFWMKIDKTDLTNFKIDSKVENVMNTAVLFAQSFRKYKDRICNSDDSDCVYHKFDGKQYFEQFILNSTAKSLFTENNFTIDCRGDSSPRYAIHQLQANLNFKKIGTWSKEDEEAKLELNMASTAKLIVRSAGGGARGTAAALRSATGVGTREQTLTCSLFLGLTSLLKLQHS